MENTLMQLNKSLLKKERFLQRKFTRESGLITWNMELVN